MDKPLDDFRVNHNFRDQIDKILNMHFFRKLSGKTQVILSLAGPSVRTRLTHTVEVARIARKLSDELGLNTELSEAIALAHDVGHTPFGHVGERSLKEILCGCDTLKGKINETDFENSGFKHNLQSFRVLRTLEAVSDEDDKWPYILWGVPVHSKMTWSKPYSGMENEILISCRHCDRVYSCYYHEKNECKRNIQEKRKLEGNQKRQICRPSFCASLEIFKNREEVSHRLEPGETREDFVGHFKDSSHVYCSKKCYLSQLAFYKILNREIYSLFPFFYDHPFPNSYYASHFYDYFKRENIDYLSVEAAVVSQADEIAQRQQDLEDAVSTGLISFELAKKDIEQLTKQSINASNQKELGEKIVDFYTTSLIKSTRDNFTTFAEITIPKVNIYCLMNFFNLLNGNKANERNHWILEQIKELASKDQITPIPELETYFSINYDAAYFYLLVYDYLDLDLRFGEYGSCRAILPKLAQLFKEKHLPDIIIQTESEPDLITTVDNLRKILQETFPKEYIFFVKPDQESNDNYWQNLSGLNLYSFHVTYNIFLKLSENKNKKSFTISDFRNIKMESIKASFNVKEAFAVWKRILGASANRVLAQLVTITNDKETKYLLKEFNRKQKNYILKSELVEKNDGKANYILKRLFSAFVTDAHQLPDEGLDYILLALISETTMQSFLINEKETFLRLLRKLQKTSIDGYDEIKLRMDNNLVKLTIEDFEKIRSSNEIVALIEKRKDLFEFHRCFVEEIKNNLDGWLRSEVQSDSHNLALARLRFRGILDNPILTAMPYWKSLLTRGICDYIASLTDQEALNQYEKLYASVMELV